MRDTRQGEQRKSIQPATNETTQRRHGSVCAVRVLKKEDANKREKKKTTQRKKVGWSGWGWAAPFLGDRSFLLRAASSIYTHTHSSHTHRHLVRLVLLVAAMLVLRGEGRLQRNWPTPRHHKERVITPPPFIAEPHPIQSTTHPSTYTHPQHGPASRASHGGGHWLRGQAKRGQVHLFQRRHGWRSGRKGQGTAAPPPPFPSPPTHPSHPLHT